MKAWLITWCWAGDHAAVEDPVVTVLRARTGAEDVRKYVEQRYIEECASLHEKLAYARYNQPQEPPYPARLEQRRIHCGHNPWLYARVVDDLRVVEDVNGNDVLNWTEPAPVIAGDV